MKNALILSSLIHASFAAALFTWKADTVHGDEPITIPVLFESPPKQTPPKKKIRKQGTPKPSHTHRKVPSTPPIISPPVHHTTKALKAPLYTPPQVNGSDNPLPTYPLIARKRGHEGHVKACIQLSKTGDIQTITIIQSSGFEELDESVKEVLKEWKFQGAKNCDQSISSSLELSFTFVLENEKVIFS